MNTRTFCIVLMIMAELFAYNENGPKEAIEKKDAELKNAIAEYHQNPIQINRSKLSSMINDIIDFKTMGRKILPKVVWDEATPEKRMKYVSQLKRLIELSSINKLELYQSDSTFYKLLENSNGEAIVSAQVWNNGRKVLLTYKMISNNSQWYVWDLVIDDLSTVRNYRDQFKTILESKTLMNLIDMLKKKADSLENQSNLPKNNEE